MSLKWTDFGAVASTLASQVVCLTDARQCETCS